MSFDLDFCGVLSGWNYHGIESVNVVMRLHLL